MTSRDLERGKRVRSSRREADPAPEEAEGAPSLALASSLGNAAVQRMLRADAAAERPTLIARQERGYAAPPDDEGYAAPDEESSVDQNAALAAMWEASVLGPLSTAMGGVEEGTYPAMNNAFQMLQVASSVAQSIANSQPDPALANGAYAIFQQIQVVGTAIGPHIGMNAERPAIVGLIQSAMTNANAFGSQLSGG